MESTILTAANHLLERTRQANNYQREIERVTGENFNLFKILNIGHYEVRTHSPLLGDLLNPKGSHGQGAKFLELFLDSLKLQTDIKIPDSFLTAFASKDARVVLEETIGQKTETTGGRMDILIKSGTNKIGIENKIYAQDQEDQILRYLSWLDDCGLLIYLTLDGSKPTSIEDHQKEKVICISYAEHIINWLEACRKEALTAPILRENLTQYIHLIQHLTHQNTSSRMDQEIIQSVLSSKETLEAFFTLRNAQSKIRDKIMSNLCERVTPCIPEGFHLKQRPSGAGENYEIFKFTTPTLEKYSLIAGIQFGASNYSDCEIGFYRAPTSKTDQKIDQAIEHLIKEFSAHQEFKSHAIKTSRDWIVRQCWSKRRHWDDEVFTYIQFPPYDFDKEILAKIKGLFDVAEAFERWVEAA